MHIITKEAYRLAILNKEAVVTCLQDAIGAGIECGVFEKTSRNKQAKFMIRLVKPAFEQRTMSLCVLLKKVQAVQSERITLDFSFWNRGSCGDVVSAAIDS